MHGSALGAAKGEGRSAAASSAVLWSVRALGPARPDYRIASERSENPGNVGLGNFVTDQRHRDFNRCLCWFE